MLALHRKCIFHNSHTITKETDMKATPIEINWHPGLPIYASESFLKAVGDEYGWLGWI